MQAAIPTAVLQQRLASLSREVIAKQSEMWRIEQILKRRRNDDPKLAAFLDVKQASLGTRAGLEPVV